MSDGRSPASTAPMVPSSPLMEYGRSRAEPLWQQSMTTVRVTPTGRAMTSCSNKWGARRQVVQQTGQRVDCVIERVTRPTAKESKGVRFNGRAMYRVERLSAWDFRFTVSNDSCPPFRGECVTPYYGSALLRKWNQLGHSLIRNVEVETT